MQERPAEPPSWHLRLRRLRRVWNRLPGNVRGGMWMLLTALLMSVTQAMLKLVGQRLPVTEFLVIRQAMILILVIPLIVRQPSALITSRPFSQALRIGIAFTGQLLGFTALVHLTLADITAIDFSKAFLITLLAIVFLKEKVGIRRWTATIIGFVGVLIMVRPGSEGFNPYALVALGSSTCWAAMPIMVRRLSRVETPLTIMLYQVFFTGLLMAPLAAYWWVPPSLEDWLLIFVVSVLTVGIQFMQIYAVRDGEPAAIAPFDYSRLLYATLLGFIVFGNLPTLYTIVGAALILSAALYTLHREHVLGRRAVTEAKIEAPS